ncbi:MAG: Hint domain-containing protein [Hyphomicrobiales bacterium]
MRSLTSYLGLVAAVGLLFQSSAALAAGKAFQVPDLGRACLPVEGRMDPDRTVACHCPPKELCPKTKAEFDAAKTLPPNIAHICCDVEESVEGCNVAIFVDSYVSCPRMWYKKSYTVPMCLQVSARADQDPAVQAAREAAATIYNACMAMVSPNIIDRLKSSKSFIKKYGTRNVSQYLNLANAEADCRQQAAAALGLGLDNNERKMLEARVADQAVKVAAEQRSKVTRDYRATVDASDQYHADNILSVTLDGALQCTERLENEICLSGNENDGSCKDCLAPDTAVSMADKRTLPMTEIKVGDEVQSTYDRIARVEEVIILTWPELNLYSINGGSLQLTADHPVMTKGGWRAVDYNAELGVSVRRYKLSNVPTLKVGDVLITDGGEVPVESIEALETRTDAKTYNLRLTGGDGFYANGILVKSH